jgi:hypothetical protein
LDRTNYTRNSDGYIIPVKNTRIHYSTLPSQIPYEITETQTYLFYQVINENNTITKMGDENIFEDCVKNSVVGISAIQQQRTDIGIYPNPSNERILVNLPSYASENADIKIFNTLGVVVFQQYTNGEEIDIDIHSLPAGIYVVRCIKNEKIISTRFVKQ